MVLMCLLAGQRRQFFLSVSELLLSLWLRRFLWGDHILKVFARYLLSQMPRRNLLIWVSPRGFLNERLPNSTGCHNLCCCGSISPKTEKKKKKKLDGNCTKMLPVILNKSWKQYLTKQQLYGHLPPSQTPSKLDEQEMWDTTGEAKTNL